MVTGGTSIEKIVDEINSKNAKKLSLFLIFSFSCYHAMLHLKYGVNSCRWLLSDGRYKGDKEWQPYGCMLHLYSQMDTKRCLRYIAYYDKQTHFVFAGDSRIRDLYNAFVDHLQEENTAVVGANTNNSMSYFDHKLNIKVEFVSVPYVSDKTVTYFRRWKFVDKRKSVIVMGFALCQVASNVSRDLLEEYKFNLSQLVKPIEKLSEHNVRVLWAIQSPINSEKLPPKLQVIKNGDIDLYNKAAIEVFSSSKAELWWSNRLIGQGMIMESLDGIHLTKRPLRHSTQILLNMYCNDYMNFNDGTCCSSMETYTTLQMVTFFILVTCVVVALLMVLHRLLIGKARKSEESEELCYSQFKNDPQQDNLYVLFTSITKMACIMAFFFLCDRTNFFMKENKYYSEFSFWLPIGYVTVLGLFFTEDAKLTKVLNRDQINEWKGWMQLVILVYQVTGASRILTINMHVKTLMSSYLFLLGFEHFCSAWYRNDIGLVNFFRKLFQLNFMTVTLCLCMNRPYQFYQFTPLLSFCYLMVYCFLAIPPHIAPQNSENIIQYFYILIKFITFFVIITILFMSEVFFEKVFVTRPWKALFVTTDDDIHEWLFRWKLDRYSVMYGMGFSLLLILAQKHNIFDDNNHFNLFSKRIAISSTLIALIGLIVYTSITLLCRNELECSEIHSYIVFIPIVSYVFLRNVSGFLRTKYSSFFAWFGEIHLELFLSQFHIWLAADTHGVLVLVPGFPVLNLIITSFIFVCISHEIQFITKTLMPYAVPNDWKLVLRNFVIFLAVLVPIGINDGMF